MKRICFLSIACVTSLTTSFGQPHPAVIDYINTYKTLAMDEMVRSGVPAAITLAQGIHESEAGQSDLVTRSRNHFGIKCRGDWSGERVYHDDDARGECFRSYTSAADSYRDHSQFLKTSPRYAFLFRMDPEDYQGWAHGLRRAGYATNIRYAHILIRIIEQYQLQQYTLIAMGKMPADQEELFAANQVSGNETMAAGPAATPESPSPSAGAAGEFRAEDYPSGVFRINETRVLYAPTGTSLLAVAEEHGILMAHLLDFNDLNSGDILQKGQLLFLQRKRKKGAAAKHQVQEGETLYGISQKEGIRLESLQAYNYLEDGAALLPGSALYLQEMAPEPAAVSSAASEYAKANAVKGTQTKPTPSSANNAKIQLIRHQVRPKETLYTIARNYGVTVEQLMDWNQLSGTQLPTGRELIIIKP